MYRELVEINHRPEPFEVFTAKELWTDEHTSAQMLEYHLNGDVDLSSRKTEFIERSAAWLVERFDLAAGKSVADFGCGPGLYTSRLAAAGAEVTGVDFSARSIEYAKAVAKREGLTIDYVLGDYLELDLAGGFDLATMIMCDLCALGPEQRGRLLAKLLACLNPGGALVFDAYTLAAFAAREEAATYAPNQLQGFWSAAPYYGFVNTFKYPDAQVVLDKYTIVEEARTKVVYNWLQYFEPTALEAELVQRGFADVELLGDVAGGDFDPTESEFAVVAKKQTD